MALNSIKVKKEQKMNWIKENKIRIIMIAVALLAVIGTVIVVTRRSGKAQTMKQKTVYTTTRVMKMV